MLFQRVESAQFIGYFTGLVHLAPFLTSRIHSGHSFGQRKECLGLAFQALDSFISPSLGPARRLRKLSPLTDGRHFSWRHQDLKFGLFLDAIEPRIEDRAVSSMFSFPIFVDDHSDTQAL